MGPGLACLSAKTGKPIRERGDPESDVALLGLCCGATLWWRVLDAARSGKQILFSFCVLADDVFEWWRWAFWSGLLLWFLGLSRTGWACCSLTLDECGPGRVNRASDETLTTSRMGER